MQSWSFSIEIDRLKKYLNSALLLALYLTIFHHLLACTLLGFRTPRHPSYSHPRNADHLPKKTKKWPCFLFVFFYLFKTTENCVFSCLTPSFDDRFPDTVVDSTMSKLVFVFNFIIKSMTFLKCQEKRWIALASRWNVASSGSGGWNLTKVMGMVWRRYRAENAIPIYNLLLSFVTFFEHV